MNFMDARLPDRFWDKCVPEPMSGCWLWFGATTKNGYGQIWVGSRADAFRKIKMAHRVAYVAMRGEIPEALECDHLCRVRCCVNPAHIELVTRSVNTLRGRIPEINQARYAAITHCPRGHEYSPGNTARYDDGRGYYYRRCMECGRAWSRDRRAVEQ